MAERKELYAAVKLIESHCVSRALSNKGCTNCDLHFLCYSMQLMDADPLTVWPDPPELEENKDG